MHLASTLAPPQTQPRVGLWRVWELGIVGALFALIYASLLCDRLPASVLLFLLSLPLSIAINVARVAGTAILADYVFVAYYAEQRSGERMHSPKECLPGGGWEIWRYGSATVPLNGRRVVVNNYSIQKGGERNIVLYWYQSGSRVIASECLGKRLLMRDAISHGRTDGALVRIVLPDRPGAIKEGVDLASALIPEIERCFGRARLTGSAGSSSAGSKSAGDVFE